LHLDFQLVNQIYRSTRIFDAGACSHGACHRHHTFDNAVLLAPSAGAQRWQWLLDPGAQSPHDWLLAMVGLPNRSAVLSVTATAPVGMENLNWDMLKAYDQMEAYPRLILKK
jgi:hypothetical protein